jgi:hypothetical protein
MVLTGLHVQPRLAVGDVSARQALILLVTKNQMLRLTTPNARTRQSPLGKTRRRGRLTAVGLRPPCVSQPRRHSHPDCRSLLTMIVARQSCLVCNQAFAPQDGGDILKYFLVLRGKHTSGEALLSGEPQNDLRFAALLS